MAEVKNTLIQQRIIKKAIAEPDFYKKIKNLRVDLFEGNEPLENIYTVVKDYYLENPEKSPTKNSLDLYASAKLDRKDASSAERMEYSNIIAGLYQASTTDDDDDKEVFDEHISSYIKNVRLTAALKELLMKDLTDDAVSKFEEDFDDIRQESSDTGLHDVIDVMDSSNSKEIAEEILKLKQNVLPIPNNAGLTKAAGGGLAKGELGAIAASQGSGKTMVMSTLATSYITGGYNVLYIALEELSGRMYSRFYNPYLGYVRKVIPDFNPAAISGSLSKVAEGYASGQFDAIKQAYEQITDVKQGSLHFTRYSPHTLSIEGLRQVIHDVIVTNGNEIDVIVVDYPDLLDIDMREGESAAGGKLYEDLRAIGQDYNVVMWLASQLNRSSGMADIKTGSSIEGSFRKINALEQFMIVNNSSDEYKAGYTRLYVEKSRNGNNKGDIISLRVEPDTKLVREETPAEASEHSGIINNGGNQVSQERDNLEKFESKQSDQERFRTHVNKQLGAV